MSTQYDKNLIVSEKWTKKRSNRSCAIIPTLSQLKSLKVYLPTED